MRDDELLTWALEFRKAALHAWDELGVPVIGGEPADEVIKEFRRLAGFDGSELVAHDANTGLPECLIARPGAGSACNQFFPTMLKTKDISTGSLRGLSVYSYFSEPTLGPAFCKFVRSLLEDDPFQIVSEVVKEGALRGDEWIRSFTPKVNDRIWVRGVAKPKAGDLLLTRSEVRALRRTGLLDAEQVIGDQASYRIHQYDPTRRIMDFRKAFRLISGSPPATNFPPAIAKYLYLKFTEHLPQGEAATVFDPSAGWGGRILGALACHNERPIHYVGTDPNSDHWMDDLEVTTYEYLASYFNSNVRGKHRNSCELFRLGSEVISQDEGFAKYRGKIDFVFTSPPYFAAEGYTDEVTQSHIKYPTYEGWRDGFLTDTLTTCVRWLRENRYLCLNIADVRFNGKVLPLQQDATDILLRLGLWQHPVLKMVLQTAPGEPKETSAGIPTIRNFCVVNGRRRKYEPILVFQKLIGHDDMHGI